MTASVAAQSVLIVMIEDDPGHARLIERNMRRAGVSNDILHFHLGTDALAYLLGLAASTESIAKRPLVIMLDLNLADMTGIDVLVKVKGDAHLKRTPVIVLTTTDDEHEIRRCYDFGASFYVTKPVSYEAFADAIRQLGHFLPVMQVPRPG